MTIDPRGLLTAKFYDSRFPGAEEALGFGVEHETTLVNLADPSAASGSVELVALLAQLPDVAVGHDSPELAIDARHKSWQYTVTTDAGRNITEVIYDPFMRLADFEVASRKAMDMLIPLARETGHVFLGVGRHPLVIANPQTWVPKRRYGGLIEFLVNGGSETCETSSHQVTVDARDFSHLLAMINVGNGLAGPMGALFANAGIFHGAAHSSELASRMRTWSRICPDRTKSRIGLPPEPFVSVEHYIDTLFGQEYILHPTESGEFALDGRTFGAALHDGGRLPVHIGCVWWDARWRLNNRHCVEFRVPCRQRQGADDLACTAFLLGLAENAQIIEQQVVAKATWSFWQRFRRECADLGLRAVLNGSSVKEVLHDLLPLVRAGLVRRGLGEESYIEPLFERLGRGFTPAEEAIGVWEREGIEGLIETHQYRVTPGSEDGLRLVHDAAATKAA